MDTYEKKYNELAGKIKKAYLYAQTDSTKAVLENILPELKESEDERIRKRIYNYINVTLDDNESVEKEKWLAWLEKQGKIKWSDEDECYLGECISAVATKDGWSFEEKGKTKHWLNSLKQRLEA